ncbi:MAG: glycoside hydrolase family 127 protein [Burkholderiales bacterium]|nr:glycoside hydrolase family 127 protein [Phycisphaerae bacterium]
MTFFGEIKTDKLRIEIDSNERFSTGILEWKVYDSGNSPDFPPVAIAGPDRVVVVGSETFLHGSGKALARPGDAPSGIWSKQSGPGEVTFANDHGLNTTATFAQPGDYVLQLTYAHRKLSATDALNVRVVQKPAGPNLVSVYTTPYKISSPFWKARLKSNIVNWIPHCVRMNDQPDLKEGGINNLIEAGNKLAGRPYKRHIGYPFSNAWVLNTVEAMAVALNVDAEGDAEILSAQDDFRRKLDEWIPIILAAQEPDGYFQTRYTLGTVREPMDAKIPHWNARYRGEHEGYVAGYFIEAGIAHYLATGGKDRRLYDASIKLADCWYDNIGPAPKQAWWDGHQEMEQALVRLGRFINDTDAPGKGQKYIDLAKFLLDCRGGGETYDQSHVPVVQQYEAVGHSVRAAYSYSAMSDIAIETGDPAYWSATLSLWDNLINRKYYVTGGIGSGETSEGFGGDYSLGHNSYCESCSNCGNLYFQHKLNLGTRQAKYASLFETILYNAILGDLDLPGKNFTYTNALDSDDARYPWHVCPCCVGNIPRTLLMLPTWMYAKSPDGLYVNLFAGSTVNVGPVAGTDVEVVQTTDYPWSGDVAIVINPRESKRFTVYIRSPQREVSTLYSAAPDSDGITSINVNGETVSAKPDENGYVAIARTWQPGDRIELVLPIKVQVIRTIEQVPANRGRVALRFGPLIYNLESADQNLDPTIGQNPTLTPQWSPDLLGGVMMISGTFSNGAELKAIPNYARLNRGGRSIVWIREEAAK